MYRSALRNENAKQSETVSSVFKFPCNHSETSLQSDRILLACDLKVQGMDATLILSIVPGPH